MCLPKSQSVASSWQARERYPQTSFQPNACLQVRTSAATRDPTSGVNRGQYLRRVVLGGRLPGSFVGVLVRSLFFGYPSNYPCALSDLYRPLTPGRARGIRGLRPTSPSTTTATERGLRPATPREIREIMLKWEVLLGIRLPGTTFCCGLSNHQAATAQMGT